MVHLADYPHIRLLFWSAPGLEDADEAMVYGALDSGWKWIDWQALTQAEKSLIDRLAAEQGNGWIWDRRVPA